MAKSIRSKRKRKNRTEFRKTIGEDFARAKLEITQSKLQECIQKGNSMTPSTFQKLSSMLNPGENDGAAMDVEKTKSSSLTDGSGEMDTNKDTVVAMISTESSEKVTPFKKETKKKHWIEEPVGQDGARIARHKINKLKRRGQFKNGVRIYKNVNKERKTREKK
mmetsp:Transcript_33323/g.40863  ORF Transcript_33323/g.40863 Transcript_33323/m.40863 type:complete len:164 (-) Transcript_33323:111-602(-)|eukprot:CAMPEP_0172503680 /NCGR_PEP_ID=MMETSP1066-20121228/171280_1 /TAXON_ID=671091 /ORGANISM="Coscinodiscus wailesii, Strain CCMP2513" /LENGTH=163 /DNA_ID=CAMNT_0013279507 /DNA_START=51 /DNA_END=542 /DNA_ORIENTATION=+